MPIKSNRFSDALAGMSIAGLLLPEAVAYAGMANMPVQAGIFGLFAGLFCYGLLGQSRFAIVSATSSSAALLAASVLGLSGGDAAHRLLLASGLVLVTGLFFFIAAIARLGGITQFIAKPVLRGFSFGLAIVITVKQFAHIIDVKTLHTDLPRNLIELFNAFAQWNWVGVAIGAAALLVLFVCSFFRYIPGGLVAIVLGVGLGNWVDLSSYGIHVVGDIAVHLNPPAIPDLARSEWMRLLELGAAMVLVLYAESYGSIRTFALKHGDTVSSNRDLWSLGVANTVSGLFQGLPVGAGFSATSANDAAGATSRWSGLIAAVMILLVLLVFLPSIERIPEPILAAIVIHAVSHSLSLNGLKPYFKWRRDRIVLLSAVFGVLLLGVLDGLLMAIAMSLLLTLKRFSASSMTELGCYQNGHDYLPLGMNADIRTLPNLMILRPNEPLFFANIDNVLSDVRHQFRADAFKALILSLEETPDLDGTTLEDLNAFVQEFEAAKQILVLARLKSDVLELLTQVNSASDLKYVQFSALSVADAVKKTGCLIQ